MRTGFDGFSRAVGINRVCAWDIGVRLNIAVDIQREGCQGVSVPVVGDFAKRGRWSSRRE